MSRRVLLVESFYGGSHAAFADGLLPHRLSYPEIIPEAFHDRVLYGNEADLLGKLRRLLTLDRHSLRLDELSKAMRRFAWDAVIDQYDREIETTVRSWRRQAP